MDTMLQKVIPLWEGCKEIPFLTEEHKANVEHFKPDAGDGKRRISGVTEGTLTFFPVSGEGKKPCVIVCPGGGYTHLAWSHEGVDICCWLNTLGFSAFLLKYRCPDQRQGAHADACRALELIRNRAEEFNIDPCKVGMMGFSAGAHLTATTSTPADPAVARPDFAALIYPGYLQESLEQGTLCVDEKTPPTLIVQAQDDFIPVEGTVRYYLELKKNNIPCEMHLYPDGGHGYGILKTGFTSENWAEAVTPWLKKQGSLR